MLKVLSLLALVLVATASASTGRVPRLIFPVVGPASYENDFGDSRWQGAHEGIDILAPRKAIAVAAEAGTVEFSATSPAAGCLLYLYGESGTTYLYVHLNNDVGKRNDNAGKCAPGTAYARGLTHGTVVEAGQPVGFVGDSGDADGLHPHLHFEMHPAGGGAVNPFRRLNAAQRLLFTATPGSTVTLSLTGTVLAAAQTLTLRVQALRVFPSGLVLKNMGLPVTLALPPDSLATGNSADSLLGQPAIVLTEPMLATLETQLGKGLTAARVAPVSAP